MFSVKRIGDLLDLSSFSEDVVKVKLLVLLCMITEKTVMSDDGTSREAM